MSLIFINMETSHRSCITIVCAIFDRARSAICITISGPKQEKLSYNSKTSINLECGEVKLVTDGELCFLASVIKQITNYPGLASVMLITSIVTIRDGQVLIL